MAHRLSIRPLIEKYWRPDIALLAGALMLSAVIFGLNAINLSELREGTLRSVEANMKSQAIVLAEESNRSFKALDLALSMIADQVARLGAGDRESLQSRLAGPDIHALLEQKSIDLLHVNAITLIDAHGKLINFSGYWPIPEVDVADRDYFRAFKANATLETFIGEPARDRLTGISTIYLARRVQARNGDFLGLVLGAISLEHFEKFFQSVSIQEGSAVALRRQDGMLLARYPHSDLVGRLFRRRPASATKALSLPCTFKVPSIDKCGSYLQGRLRVTRW